MTQWKCALGVLLFLVASGAAFWVSGILWCIFQVGVWLVA